MILGPLIGIVLRLFPTDIKKLKYIFFPLLKIMNSISSKNFGVKSLNSKSVEQSLLIDELKLKLQAFSDSVDVKLESISQRLTTIENQLLQHDMRLSEIES